MRDWREYWNHSEQVRDEDPYRQVGKTVSGAPIGEAELDAIVADIRARLRLGPEDRLLELCCGNGMVTQRLSAFCAHITACDFSEPLLAAARQRPASAGLEYRLADVLELPADVAAARFDKLLMYEALQHFDPGQAGRVFDQVARLPGPGPDFYLGSIPDRERIRNFYDTPRRWREYQARRREGTEAIGHWWTRDELTGVAGRHGYRVETFDRSASPHTAHYRFDALCRPETVAGA